MRTRTIVFFVIGLLIIPLLFFFGREPLVYAQSVEQLQAQISEKNQRLKDIEAEIKKYESELTKVGAEKSTLQKAINQLELERKKVQADIRYTENKIESTNLTLNKLSVEINRTEGDIDESKDAIAAILRSIRTTDDDSMIELILRQENLAAFWNEIAALETVKANISERVDLLEVHTNQLTGKRNQTTAEKLALESLKKQYSDQQSILVGNKSSKETLLKETKNQESNYQKLLKDKKAAKEQLEAEVANIESQIKFILDPNSIPSKGTAVLAWPLKNPIITQSFGYTKFALSGAYGGSKHNGMDMGTPVGTPVHAPLTGTIRDTGNTDAVPGCYSWGKWVLLDHPNGLSSMFAHLSQISTTPGQKVNTGDIIGYSGNTGYSTGPHLHYTLYVKDAVQVKQFNQFKSVTSCGAAKSPFAAIEGYLNPQDYLPSL